MKKLLLPMLIISMAANLTAQNKLSANLYGSYFFPYNDFTQTTYTGYKRNVGLGMGLGYDLGSVFRLRGDLATGILNGNNYTNYYETKLYEAQLGLDFNIIHLFNKDYNTVKFNLQGGIGSMWYYARLYDRKTGAKLIESPVRDTRSMSPNGFISYGANISFAITPKLDLNFGMTNRLVDAVDWMDAQKSGDYNDSYGMAQLGLIFYLKSDKDPNSVEVEKKRYQQLLSRVDSASNAKEQNTESRERIAELEMTNQEQKMKINQLQNTLDSVKMKRVSVDTTREITSEAPKANVKEILGTPQYRIVVASLPTEVMAQRWINKSQLDHSEMVIAYIDNLHTYRVVYKSYPSYEAARKELLQVKSVVSDAWIVKF